MMGFVQVSIFGLILFLGLVNMLVPFLRLINLKNIEKLYSNWKMKSNSRFKRQNETKSTNQFDLIKIRKEA